MYGSSGEKAFGWPGQFTILAMQIVNCGGTGILFLGPLQLLYCKLKMANKCLTLFLLWLQKKKKESFSKKKPALYIYLIFSLFFVCVFQPYNSNVFPFKKYKIGGPEQIYFSCAVHTSAKALRHPFPRGG